MNRLRRRSQRLNIYFTPKQNERACFQQGCPRSCQEEAVALGASSPACSSKPLEKRGHSPWGIQLDNMVEVADVDAQFQRTCGYNHAVSCFAECRFCVPTLLRA